MSEHYDFHDDSTASDFPHDDSAIYTHEGSEYDYSYDFEHQYEQHEPEASEVGHDEDTIPYIPEDPAPETGQRIVWTRGRVLYAMVVMLFVVVLVVYTLIPVFDHFINPPPPPILPPPWMA